MSIWFIRSRSFGLFFFRSNVHLVFLDFAFFRSFGLSFRSNVLRRISRHIGECVNICLQKLLLCLIILTFNHEKSVWLVLKCIHDLQKNKHTKQTNKKTERKKFKKNQNIYESRIKSRIFVE
jgi:hypothetical protein